MCRIYVDTNSWLSRDEGIKIGQFLKSLYREMLYSNVVRYVILLFFIEIILFFFFFSEVATQVKEPQPASVCLKESCSIYGDQGQSVNEHSNHHQDTLLDLLPLEQLEGIKL